MNKDSNFHSGPWNAFFIVGCGWNVQQTETKFPICSMAWFQFENSDINEIISEANAKLIAAAPEMFAICKEMRKKYSDDSKEGQMLDAVIRKVIGD